MPDRHAEHFHGRLRSREVTEVAPELNHLYRSILLFPGSREIPLPEVIEQSEVNWRGKVVAAAGCSLSPWDCGISVRSFQLSVISSGSKLKAECVG
jgi:hypothetical protein